MAALASLEALIFFAGLVLAVRRARPAQAPYARRIAWIGLMLAAQAAVLYGFIAFHRRTHWGIDFAIPPGVAGLTQALRAAFLLAATSGWLGLIGPEIQKPARRAVVALAFLAFAYSGRGLPGLAALVLLFTLDRMTWIESIAGWRRAVALVGSAVLLAAMSFLPVTTIADGVSTTRLVFTLGHWPPLLGGALAPGAANELALIHPFERLLEGLADLFRVQLLVATAKFLFLPIRLSGMSLKRRFTINYLLVRSIPAFLSAVILVAFGYLVLGHLKLTQARGELEHTLARASTVAAVLADDPAVRERRPPDPLRLAAAARWMTVDSAGTRIIVRDSVAIAAQSPDSLAAVTTARDSALAASFPGVAPELVAARFAGADSGDARGMVVVGDALYLGVRRVVPGARAIEVFVPVDSLYLARIMRPIGGDLKVSAQPHVFVGNLGLNQEPDSLWTPQLVVAQTREPDPAGSRRQHWYLARTYLPSGDWDHVPRATTRGAIEVYLSSTPGSLLRGTTRSLTGLYANLFTFLIVIVVVAVFSMIERFAVRSGRSIIQAVLDEMTTLREAAERFGKGDLAYRLPVQGRDEFSVVAASFNDMAANLERQQAELVANERLEQDLEVARGIQQRFLPQQSPGIQGLDVAGVSVPSREVGGDLFYWFTHADGSLGFTLGDVSGKSVPAALLMSNVLAALRTTAIDHVELAESLTRTNRLIVDMFESGRFVTLFYGEADPAAGVLRYASAGHNPPLLLRADGTPEWLREGGVPLGVMPDTTYATTTVRFEPGDTLVVYSDGVTEAERAGTVPPRAAQPGAEVETPEPELFGEERLATLAFAHRGQSARAVLDALLDAVHAFASGAAQADDITIVVVKRG